MQFFFDNFDDWMHNLVPGSAKRGSQPVLLSPFRDVPLSALLRDDHIPRPPNVIHNLPHGVRCRVWQGDDDRWPSNLDDDRVRSVSPDVDNAYWPLGSGLL